MVVDIFSTVFPVTDATEALIPPPFVPVLSKLAKSPTLYPWPASCISNDLTEPLLTDSIVELCNNISFGSLIKSLSDPTSPTAYGNVFLTKSELLKSNVWSTTCSINFDLYELPM